MLFEVISVLGMRIPLSKEQWEKIVRDKHPLMRGKEALVRDTLTDTDLVRRSKMKLQMFSCIIKRVITIMFV